MPTDPADLCTVAQVKEQVVTSSSSSDTLIQTLITAASKQIMTWARREFAPADAGPTAWKFPYRGSRALFLGSRDLRSATLVRIDTDTSTPTTLVAATDYFLRPIGSRWGTYEWIELPGQGGGPGGRDREVEVTGAWGFAAVPSEARQACIVTVRAWLTREGGFAFADDTGREVAPGPPNIYWLPASARHLVSPLRRVGVG